MTSSPPILLRQFIYHDLNKFQLPEDIIQKADEISSMYKTNKIFRGRKRVKFAFYCVVKAYEYFNYPIDISNLGNTVFKLERKDINDAIKMCAESTISKDVKIISPEDMVNIYCSMFNISSIDRDKIITFMDETLTKDESLKDDFPGKLAIGFIYIYCCRNNYNMPIDYFSSKINISLQTLKTMEKRICQYIKE